MSGIAWNHTTCSTTLSLPLFLPTPSPCPSQEQLNIKATWWRTACIIRELMELAPPDWEILQLLPNNNATVLKVLNESTPFVPWDLKHWGAQAYLINRAGQQKLMAEFLKEGHQFLGVLPAMYYSVKQSNLKTVSPAFGIMAF